MNEHNNKKIVFILGMHRSGTSLLANILSHMGVSFGKNLIPGDKDNEAGYWEQKDIVTIHEKILKQMDRPWIYPTGTLPIEDHWWNKKSFDHYKNEIIHCLQRELQDKNIFGLKDPRISRFLPFWDVICTELNIDPVFILTFRHPHDVTASLIKRDKITPQHAELLWFIYNIECIDYLGARISSTLQYCQWFINPQDTISQLNQILDLSISQDQQDEIITKCIQPNLRHNQVANNSFTNPLIEQLYHLLIESTSQININQYQSLIQLYHQALRLFQPWMDLLEKTQQEKDAIEQKYHQLYKDNKNLFQDYNTLHQYRLELEQNIEQIKKQITNLG